MVDHHNLTGYSQIVEELDATGAVVATYHYGHDLISQSRLVLDPASGSSEWVDRIFLYDGFSQVGADSGAVGGGEEGGRAPESLAPQAVFLRDASGSHVGAYAPLESPLQFPLLASIPLRENKGGSVRALTDLEGNITDTFSYDAYGNLLHPSFLFLPTSYLYRGERWDPDLGQYYLRARFYDANLGRFHTLDEYEGRTGEPLSLHKYLYAHGNPVSGWDPSGRMTLAGWCSTVFVLTSVAGIGIPNVARIVSGLPPSMKYVYAYLDGINPFFDYFATAGYYPANEKDYMYSRMMGTAAYYSFSVWVGAQLLAAAAPAGALAQLSKVERGIASFFMMGHIVAESSVHYLGSVGAAVLGSVLKVGDVANIYYLREDWNDYWGS